MSKWSRIRVITSCTGEKTVSSDEALTLEDFRKGAAHVESREAELSSVLTSAEDLYSGQQHVRLMRGIRSYRSANGNKADIDLWILSAGYGLIPSDQKLAPYECTFQDMRNCLKSPVASELKPRKLTKRVEKALFRCSEAPKWRLQGLL